MAENKNSKAKIAANNRYSNKNYDRINLAVPKGRKAEIESIAKERGYGSVNKFVNTAIDEKILRDKEADKSD